MTQILMRKNVALKKIPKITSFTCISGLALHFWQRVCPSRHCQISPGGAMSSCSGWWFSTITNKKRFAQRFLQSESCQPGRMVIFNHGQQETEIPTNLAEWAGEFCEEKTGQRWNWGRGAFYVNLKKLLYCLLKIMFNCLVTFPMQQQHFEDWPES